MAQITVVVEGGADLYRIFGIDPIKVIEPAFEPGGRRVEAGFKVYPTPPGQGEWAAKTSPRQKAAFFAKLRNGEWTGRTGQYGGSWVIEMSASPGTVTAEVRNPVEYSGWVGGDATQAAVHRNRWVTDIDLLNREEPRLVADVQARILQAYAV